MNIWKKLKAFTLIEMIIVLLIIGILSIWITNINFNKISWKQKLETFTNKLVSNFETVRNNALLWKWIWTDLSVPEKWKIEIWAWWLLISYYSWSWINYEDFSLPIEKFYELYNTRCFDINSDEKEDDNTVWTWSIITEWSNLTLSWCNNSSSKIFKFTIKYQNDSEKNLSINILNWLIEVE